MVIRTLNPYDLRCNQPRERATMKRHANPKAHPNFDEEHFAEWLRVLRTTTLPQGEGTLVQFSGDEYDEFGELLEDAKPLGYCCLGIGEKVCVGKTIDEISSMDLATSDFIEWLGLDIAGTGDYYDLIVDWPVDLLPFRSVTDQRPEGARITAAWLNDSGCTFSQIADVLDYFGFTGTYS